MLKRGVIALIGAVALGVLLVACDDEQKAETFIARAKTERASGDLPAAARDLRTALQIDGSNSAARLILAQIALDMSDPAAAEAAALRAQQDGISELDTIKLVTKARLVAGHNEDVLRTTGKPPAGASPELAASLQAFRARALAGLDRFVAAHETLDLGLSQSPHSLDLLIAGVRIAMLEGDVVAARRRLVDAVIVAPDDLELAQLAGDIAFSVGQYGEAEQAYRKIVDAQPWSIGARSDVARAQIAGHRLKEAIANLEQLLNEAPESPEVIYLRGLAAFEEGDFSRAFLQATAVLGREREFYGAQLIGGAASYATGRNETAKNYLAAYVELFPSDAVARQLLTAVDTALDAAQGEASAAPPDQRLLAAAAAAALREGDPTIANRFVKEKAADLRAAPAVAEPAPRNFVAELEAAVTAAPDAPGARASLYFGYMHAKAFDKALAVTAELDRLKPNDAIVADLAGVAHLARGDLKAGRASLERARALRPDDYDANNNLAQLAIAAGRPDEARQLYRGLLKDHPQSVRWTIALAELEDAAGHGEAAEGLLQQAVKANPADIVAHAALAKFQLAKGKYLAALNEALPVLAKYPRSPILLEAVGRAYLAMGQAGAALGAFKKLVQEQSWDGSAHLYLADAFAVEGLWDAVVSEAGQALKLSPGDDGARFALARGLFAQGRLTETRSLVDTLKAAQPDNPAVNELDGLLARAQGRRQDAIAAFKAVLKADDNSVDRLLLAQAQAAAGASNDAEATLKSWLEAHPEDLALHKHLGDLYLARERAAEALPHYEVVVKADPKNAAAVNNLAWTLLRLGRNREALPYARSAAALDDNSPDNLDTYGGALLLNGRAAEAVAALSRAAQLSPGVGPVQLHLAEALSKAGQNDQALDVLHAMLAGKQPFNGREDAQRLLERLGG